MTEQVVADRFAEFTIAARDREPFAWQVDLADQLVAGDLPSVVDVPTGMGKTSIIDAWAYALAVHAGRAERMVPLRMCLVVDRRLVVDEAFKTAGALADQLAKHVGSGGAIGQVATALASLSGGAAPPLHVVRMRGGATWDARWVSRPDQPTVVVGTVDQFGSRLLFRGYGVSEGMRPINAALLGIDCWLVVDEAHIAGPLVATAERVARHQRRVTGSMSHRALAVTQMSATVATDGSVVRADPEREAASHHREAAKAATRRLRAAKPTELVDLAYLAGPAGKRWRAKYVQLGADLAKVAAAAAGDAGVVAVIANTIVTARAAWAKLSDEGHEVVLLIGRCREYEREEILNEFRDRMEVGRPVESRGRQLFVVATQTIEVGANYDFDLMVTEVAPLASLTQRFGRVNRLGDRPARTSIVVHAGFAHGEEGLYGLPARFTWEYLYRLAGATHLANARQLASWTPAQGTIDFGPLAARRLAFEAPQTVVPPDPFTPVALGAHFERWAATSPTPMPDQPVGAFLHGAVDSVAEVAVAWRARPPRIPETGEEQSSYWQLWLALSVPVDWEFVTVPIWEVRALLDGRPPVQATTDIEGLAGGTEPDVEAGDEALGVVYRGPGRGVRLIRGGRDVTPGDQVVLRSDLGGHDSLGWTGIRSVEEQPPVPDVADLAPDRKRGTVRWGLPVLSTWMTTTSSTLAAAFLEGSPGQLDGVIAAVDAESRTARLLNLWRVASAWSPQSTRFTFDAASDSVVLLLEPAAEAPRAPIEAVSDDDVASTSLTGVRRVTLNDHGVAVGAMARQFASHLGLGPLIEETVARAGRLHDLGKADPRFQVMLHDGDTLAARTAVDPLAKSGRDPRSPVASRARELAGLPPFFPHEALSGDLVKALLAQRHDLGDDVDIELLIHLVVSHHGAGRPLMRPVSDSDPQLVRVVVEGVTAEITPVGSFVDWSQPGRFERLCGVYGEWGLAALETIVRLADMACSEDGQ